MSLRKNRKHERPTPVARQPAKGAPWALIAVVIVAVAAGAGIVASRYSDDDTATLTASSAPTMATDPSPAAEGTGASEVSATSFTPEGPNDLPMPPLPYASQMSGTAEQVRAAYVFAAQNPGLLEYVPCYCGCELDGHNSNVDCFVESRTPDGAVRAWDSHGMTWVLCLSVARDAMQMHALGASVADISGAVRTKYAANYPSSTPTPAVPQ